MGMGMMIIIIIKKHRIILSTMIILLKYTLQQEVNVNEVHGTLKNGTILSTSTKTRHFRGLKEKCSETEKERACDVNNNKMQMHVRKLARRACVNDYIEQDAIRGGAKSKHMKDASVDQPKGRWSVASKN